MSDKGKSKKGKGGDAKAAAGGGSAWAGPASGESLWSMPDVPQGLPPEVLLARTRVICGPDFNSNVRARRGRAGAWRAPNPHAGRG
jgi:hypothetical protein